MTGFPATLRLASVLPVFNARPRLTSSIPCTIFADQFEVFERTKGVSVSESTSQPVSGLLNKWRSGDQEALQALIPLVYQELRRIAQHHLRQERPDHTLQSTALVHEAYLRLMKQGPAEVENRGHFMAVASRLMRQILVDHARGHRAAKRGGGLKLELKEDMGLQSAPSVDLVTLDNALNELARLDPQQNRIVEMRFFGGLSIEETADVIGISRTTVKREWATARAWLRREVGKAEER
jgi:RNA polymerase sigma factor (TIGR02999 family)